MNYCNGVKGFINFATSIPRNFTEGGIRCLCRKCQNKKYLHPDVVTMHLLHKGFMKDYLCWYAHRELFVRNDSMGERVVGSTSSASNVHWLSMMLTGIWLWMLSHVPRAASMALFVCLLDWFFRSLHLVFNWRLLGNSSVLVVVRDSRVRNWLWLGKVLASLAHPTWGKLLRVLMWF